MCRELLKRDPRPRHRRRACQGLSRNANAADSAPPRRWRRRAFVLHVLFLKPGCRRKRSSTTSCGTGGGLMGSNSGRFFGWVFGGTLPVAIAADWLTSAWDQNGASNSTSPAEAVVEEVCGEWPQGTPRHSRIGFIRFRDRLPDGTHDSARRRAQQAVKDRGWDVERSGLAGAPPLRILTTENRQELIMRSVRLSASARMRSTTLQPTMGGASISASSRKRFANGAGIADPLASGRGFEHGVFDHFARACPLAHAANAWVHVDGAFGLWVATSKRHCHLLDGVEQADSWATDGHKWLNVPFEFRPRIRRASVRPPRGLRARHELFGSSREAAQSKGWNPEWSRRARGFPVYAAIRALGRSGIGEIVDRCCACAERLIAGIGELPGAEIVAAPTINQGLVRFLADDGNHDRATDEVIGKIQAEGVAGSAARRGAACGSCAYRCATGPRMSATSSAAWRACAMRFHALPLRRSAARRMRKGHRRRPAVPDHARAHDVSPTAKGKANPRIVKATRRDKSAPSAYM